MPTERVLIVIETIANTAGIQQAKAGLLGFGPAALVASLALGGLIMAGKSAIAISQEHFKAEANLANAIKNRGADTQKVNETMNAFMQTNRDFISNQNDVINSWAALTREGVKSKDISHLMSLALNIQATEGGTLTEAVTKLQMAEIGRNRGLAIGVGLVLKSIPAHATLAQKQAIVAYNIRQMTKAYGDQKPKVDPLVVATNLLKTDWENIAEKYGPALIGQVAAIAKSIDEHMPSWITWGEKIGHVVEQLYALAGMANQSTLDIYNAANAPGANNPDQLAWNAAAAAANKKAAAHYNAPGANNPDQLAWNAAAAAANKKAAAHYVTIHVNGAQHPQAVARAITQHLRRLGGVN